MLQSLFTNSKSNDKSAQAQPKKIELLNRQPNSEKSLTVENLKNNV